MDNIIRRAIYLYSKTYDKPVEYEIKDCSEVKDELKERDIQVTDFPTTLFYQDDIIVFTTTGTKTAESLRRDMFIHFD